jgi:fructose/tagatose bisphosphate aldolase
MEAAEIGGYAVGYFESWSIDSLLAVADAAVIARSPVILGFSGIHLPQAVRMQLERLPVFGVAARELCRTLPVPVSLLFNESPHWDWVLQASRSGFNAVMYADDETLGYEDLKIRVRSLVQEMRDRGVAVEAETSSVPGMIGSLADLPQELKLTHPARAHEFVRYTGVDALAVNLGQAHLHGRRAVRLDLALLRRIREAVYLPLVLHGATSVDPEHLEAAIRLGIRKVNVGSSLKRVYFEALRSACENARKDYNPYDVVGSGRESDVLRAAREKLEAKVVEWMRRLGSAGEAVRRTEVPV